MEQMYYRNDIKKAKTDFNEKTKKISMISNIVLLFSFLAIVIVTILAITLGNYFLFIILILPVLLLMIILIIRYTYMQTMFRRTISELVVKIFNGDGQYNMSIPLRADVIDLLQQSRISYKYDWHFLREAYVINIDADRKAYYINALISRSNGQSSQQIIDGEIYILEINNKLNYQIRNDNAGMKDSTKVKSESYKLYYPKDLKPFEVDDEDFFNVYKMFKDSKSVGIDYQDNRITVFNNMKYQKLTTLELSEANIKIYLNNMKDKIARIEKLYAIFNQE